MSTINRRASKRRRRRPPHQSFHTPTSTEERFLHQAIQNSKLDRARPKDGKLEIPWGPTFHPTVQDMEGSPLDFIEKVRPIAQRYGICKIVPPKGWDPTPFSKCHPLQKHKHTRMAAQPRFYSRAVSGFAFDGQTKMMETISIIIYYLSSTC